MSESQAIHIRAEFPPKLHFLFDPYRYKVAFGGRGGAKSWSYARALLILALRKRLRILCARELQVSISDSVHKLLKEQIETMALGSSYVVTQHSIIGRNGSEFLFCGIRSNITKVKSMEGIDICWVEEAERVSEESWSVLIPTIRKSGSEIWVSFNPDAETDPTYARFISNAPPESMVVKIGWQDNPWISTELIKEKDYSYRVDPDAADHVWGGKPKRISKSTVLFGKYIVEEFAPQEDWTPLYGADFGFARDPTVIIKAWVHGRKLYIEHEAYGMGVETVDLPDLFAKVPGAKHHTIRADGARPENISHLRNNGFPKIMACEKWAGSVEDGVSHLRSYEKIIIHPRCRHTVDEAGLWSYKTDRLTGDVLPELVPRHDHCWDSVRYACGPLIKSRNNFSEWRLDLNAGLGGSGLRDFG